MAWTDPPVAGGSLPECLRASSPKSGVTFAIGRFLKRDTQTTVTLASAGQSTIGVSTNLRTDGYVEYQYGGVVAVEAGEAITAVTSSNPTRIYVGVDGVAMSTAGSSAYAVGEVDESSPDAGAAGDLIYVKLYEAPQKVAIGQSFTSGSGSAAGGADGDWYLKTGATPTLYHKASGSWTAVLVGTAPA